MSPIAVAWLAAFAASLAVVLVASDRLVNVVEAAGDRYQWPPGLVGLLAAAGADGPEVSSALIALLAGAHDVSLGVIVGSNLFNLAALVGLPILLLGHVAVQRYGLLMSGGAMLLTTALSILLLLGDTPLPFVEALVVATLLGYALMLARSRDATMAVSPSVLQDLSPDRGDLEEEERARETRSGPCARLSFRAAPAAPGSAGDGGGHRGLRRAGQRRSLPREAGGRTTDVYAAPSC